MQLKTIWIWTNYCLTRKDTLGNVSKDVINAIPGIGDKNKEALTNFA